MGDLMILEKSHLQEELKQSYGQSDVDVYCENEGEAIALIAQARGENRELTSEEKQSIKWTTLGAFAADPMDERWVGKNPIMNSVRVAKGMIC